jgi:tetratricopeptide (TPR) repeat protein
LLGNSSEAEEILRPELAVADAGGNSLLAADIREELARALRDAAKYAEAATLLDAAMQARRKMLGEHVLVATAIGERASVFEATGALNEAESAYVTARDMLIKIVGPKDSRVAVALGNLGVLSLAKGDYKRASEFLNVAERIQRERLGRTHPDYAATLSNLATAAAQQGDFALALALHERARSIRRAAFGEAHPEVAVSLSNLAVLLWRNGYYSRALPHAQEALRIREQMLPAGHPLIAMSLVNLAGIYWGMGDLAKARSNMDRGLELQRAALGSLNPYTAVYIREAAALSWGLGDKARALALLTDGAEAEEANLSDMMSVGSEAQKRAALDMVSGALDLVLSFHLKEATRNPAAARLALRKILQYKGRLADAVADEFGILGHYQASGGQDLGKQLLEVRKRRAALQLRNPKNVSMKQAAELKRVREEEEKLEESIAKLAPAEGAILKPVTLSVIEGSLPPESALVEFAVYRPFDPRAPGMRKRWADEQYCVCVLKKGDPVCYNLGPAAQINKLARGFHAALAGKHPGTESLAREVYDRIFARVVPLLGDAVNLIVA